MSAPTLAHTQQLLWKLITAPEGAAAGLARLAPPERAVAERLVRGDQRLSALARVDVYADMYFYRIRDCLAEDFSAVRAVLGEAAFHNLVTDYLIAYPPSHFSLRYAGQHLPGFLDGYPGARQWPFASALAALEWSILDAFDAPDAEPLDASMLREVPEAHWPQLRFRLTPSLRILQTSWPVDAILQRVQGGEPLDDIASQPTATRVWRQELRVFHRAMDAIETASLTAVARELPFETVCEEIVACVGAVPGIERAYALIANWLDDALLTGFSAT